MALKWHPFLKDGGAFFVTWNRLAANVAFGALLGTILFDMGWILDEFSWIWASFLKDFGCFSAAAFLECQSRLARNEITENVKNIQKIAESRESQTQTKTHKSKFRSRFCKLQIADSCTKHPSSNAGAAVLAPHGAFGSYSVQ